MSKKTPVQPELPGIPPPPSEKLKGSISFDSSKKGTGRFGQPKFHNAWRATVVYNGKRYRKRSLDRADCVRFLEEMAEKYRRGLV